MPPDTLLFHLSDIHFGLEDKQALDWVKHEIAEQRPAAVAITGDLTMRARHHEFAAACRWIQSLAVPITVEVGNHDMPYFNLVERFVAPYRRFRAIEGLIERELDLADLAIVPLKTAVRAQPRLDWSKGWVTPSALKSCLAALDALPAGKRALVAVHHPLREVGTKGTALTLGGHKALDELARRRVLAVLSGHVHDPFDLVEQTDHGPMRRRASRASPWRRSTRCRPPTRRCIEPKPIFGFRLAMTAQAASARRRWFRELPRERLRGAGRKPPRWGRLSAAGLPSRPLAQPALSLNQVKRLPSEVYIDLGAYQIERGQVRRR